MHVHPIHFRRFDRRERVKALVLGGWFFLTVATLWLLKSVRSAALVSHLGAHETPYVVLASAGAVGVAVAV